MEKKRFLFKFIFVVNAIYILWLTVQTLWPKTLGGAMAIEGIEFIIIACFFTVSLFFMYLITRRLPSNYGNYLLVLALLVLLAMVYIWNIMPPTDDERAYYIGTRWAELFPVDIAYYIMTSTVVWVLVVLGIMLRKKST